MQYTRDAFYADYFVLPRAHAVYRTSAHERLLESLSEGTSLDHEYILYASQRSTGQRDGNIGQVTFSI